MTQMKLDLLNKDYLEFLNRARHYPQLMLSDGKHSMVSASSLLGVALAKAEWTNIWLVSLDDKAIPTAFEPYRAVDERDCAEAHE